MSPPRSSFTPSRPWRTGIVWAVGRHVFVHCPHAIADRVRLTLSEDGSTVAGSLADGVEVEILAWRPRGASGTRYRVRAAEGLVGWLSTNELRGTLAAPPAPREEVDSTPPPAMPASRFGARR